MSAAKFTEKIAFRSHDNEGDVWCEHAFLFEDDHHVRAFFYETNPLLIEIFADGGDGKLHNFKVYDGNPAQLINTVSFWTDDAHEVIIKRMADGHVLERP